MAAPRMYGVLMLSTAVANPQLHLGDHLAGRWPARVHERIRLRQGSTRRSLKLLYDTVVEACVAVGAVGHLDHERERHRPPNVTHVRPRHQSPEPLQGHLRCLSATSLVARAPGARRALEWSKRHASARRADSRCASKDRCPRQVSADVRVRRHRGTEASTGTRSCGSGHPMNRPFRCVTPIVFRHEAQKYTYRRPRKPRNSRNQISVSRSEQCGQSGSTSFFCLSSII